jgi:hypothetical protein
MFVSGTRVHWPAAIILEALELAEAGLGDIAISRRTGIPAHTVRTYRRRPPRRARELATHGSACGVCGAVPHRFADLPSDIYAYLLGAYLGDGCISTNARTLQLRIVLDLAYPRVIDEVAAAILCVRGREPGRLRPSDGAACVVLASAWKQWACLFPQHGAGPKHERPIELEPWQRAHIDAAPQMFLRGLVHSDGCRVINRFKTKLGSGRVAEYEYPRYFFSNRSLDILGLFSDTCDLLGIRWTRSNHRNLSVSHRASVALMDTFIGPKA